MKFLLSSKLTLILIIFLFSLFNELKFYEGGELEIFFLEIGQGDSFLIKTPDKKTLLVDAGETNVVLSKLSEVLPYSHKEIDFLMVSHFDLDHYGGAIDLLTNYKVNNLIYSDYYELNDPVQAFFSNTKGINRIDFSVQKNLRIGCCTYLKILWPPEDQNGDKNDLSISFELVYKNFQLIGLGDASSDIEEEVATKNWIDADILKASHHGSKTSSSTKFIQLSKPDIAVISAGKGNKFHHPHPNVLENFENNDVKILRTDLSGTIKISSDGFSFK